MGELKNIRIAVSGIYDYGYDELPSLGLPYPGEGAPDWVEKKQIYKVYRPATVLKDACSLFKMLPMTHNHPDGAVDGANFRKLVVGYTGENPWVDYVKDRDEVGIRSTCMLSDDEALDAYNRGEIQLSPGYVAEFDWKKGKAPDGEEYDAVMKKITEVNHVALLPSGRGGAEAAVLDHAVPHRVTVFERPLTVFDMIPNRDGYRREGHNMSILTGLFRSARKKVAAKVVADGKREETFREKLDALVGMKDSLTEDGVAKQVEAIKALTGDLPDSEGKDKLGRCLEDFKQVKGQPDAVAREAANSVSDLYERLDKDAELDADLKGPDASAKAGGSDDDPVPAAPGEAPDKDNPGTGPKPKDPGAPDDPAPEDVPPADPAKDCGDEGVSEDEAPTPGQAPSAPVLTTDMLEQIWNFVKGKMDEAAKDKAPDPAPAPAPAPEAPGSEEEGGEDVPVDAGEGGDAPEEGAPESGGDEEDAPVDDEDGGDQPEEGGEDAPEEDAPADDEGGEDETKDGDGEMTADHAPVAPVRLSHGYTSDKGSGSGLRDLFAIMKNGGR